MSLDQITDVQLIRSLRSGVCPACGGAKRPRQTFCGPDYYRLPTKIRTSLYDPLGDGYRQAVAEAMRVLGGSGGEFRLPDPPAAPLFESKSGRAS